jgi:TRAP-type mannitol/chloroaromatic compound transport system permease small subunit
MIEAFCRFIDVVNDWTGKIVCWLIIPITLIVTAEVILRYLFNKPTIWAWDISVQLFAAFVILGGSYALRHSSHIGVDIIILRFSLRIQAMISLVTSILFFLSIGVLLWESAEAAWKSLLARETMSTYFRPPIYPLRIVVAFGVLLLLLQGVSKFILDLNKVVRSGRDHKL